ncbi:Proteinase inhibitor- propeptide [Striga hermonthica]|uniref:Proteinase inhibitor- propeptide n=1 Tax=Striga hermonthica TaxID=68872 RepID=A0A9N7NQP7_STRHE|nr:Proteinase inhibitor- propeptide [Striga hermonthica]
MRGDILVFSFLCFSPSIFLAYAATKTHDSNLPSRPAKGPEPSSNETTYVYVVYTDPTVPTSDFYKLLIPVLGSEKAAKDAIGYTFEDFSGIFSAKLTRDQASILKKEPEIIEVNREWTYHLDGQLAHGSP